MEELHSALTDDPEAAAIDLLEGSDAYLLVIDVPGATAQGTTVEFVDRTLKIRADGTEHRPNGSDEVRTARPDVLEFDLPLPRDIDAEPASASIDRGVLEIRLPKDATSMDRTIPVEDG